MEVRRLIDRYGVPVIGYTPEHNAYPFNYMIGSEAQRRDAVDYLKLSLDMAKEMGAEFVLTSPANGGCLATYDELWARLEETVRELGDHAAKTGIKFFYARQWPAGIIPANRQPVCSGNVRRGTAVCPA